MGIGFYLDNGGLWLVRFFFFFFLHHGGPFSCSQKPIFLLYTLINSFYSGSANSIWHLHIKLPMFYDQFEIWQLLWILLELWWNPYFSFDEDDDDDSMELFMLSSNTFILKQQHLFKRLSSRNCFFVCQDPIPPLNPAHFPHYLIKRVIGTFS